MAKVMASVMSQYEDVVNQMVLGSGEEPLKKLMGAEAFATATGIIVLDKSYRDLKQTFVPFHTHLGHPASFTGIARFAPTAEDIAAHRQLMLTYQRSHRTGLSLPGLIIHASGEITIFYAPAFDRERVTFEVIHSNGWVERADVGTWDLEQAFVTGTLSVWMREGNLSIPMDAVGGQVFVHYRPIDLWERKEL